MKRSLFIKIFAGYVLITLLLTGAIFFFTYRTVRSHYIDLLSSDMTATGKALGLRFGQLIRGNQLDELNALAREFDRATHNRITVIALDGTVLADSEQAPASMQNHADRHEVRAVLSGQPTARSIHRSTTLKREMLYVALPVADEGRTLGVLRISRFIHDINLLLKSLQRSMGHIVLAVLLLALAGAMVLAKKLSAPLKELSTAARDIAAGDFSATVSENSGGEVRELARSFNHMSARIRELFAGISEKEQQLQTIISSIAEGLFVFDRGGRITLANRSFKAIIGDAPAEGRFYWEIIRNPEFRRVIEAATHQSRAQEVIELNGRFYLCSVAAVGFSGESVALLHDVTDIRNLEQVKKDLIASVSHELRTPLTAIKGFAETLEEGCQAEQRHYLDIIRRHADRLIAIVEDLLTLSRVESGGRGALVFADIGLAELFTNIRHLFESKLKEKNLSLTVDIAPGAEQLCADPSALEQLFINLIDNAVKYTDKGGIIVRVARENTAIRISVTDTGIGIPPEHLPRIFERFYVADKSRSKKQGGTGLGLAIAKHITLLHNGSIVAESTPNTGTVLTVRLPITQS